MQFLGASDTAGNDVDCTKDMNGSLFMHIPLFSYRTHNCNLSYVQLVGNALDADIEVLANGGLGIIDKDPTNRVP